MFQFQFLIPILSSLASKNNPNAEKINSALSIMQAFTKKPNNKNEEE